MHKEMEWKKHTAHDNSRHYENQAKNIKPSIILLVVARNREEVL